MSGSKGNTSSQKVSPSLFGKEQGKGLPQPRVELPQRTRGHDAEAWGVTRVTTPLAARGPILLVGRRQWTLVHQGGGGTPNIAGRGGGRQHAARHGSLTTNAAPQVGCGHRETCHNGTPHIKFKQGPCRAGGGASARAHCAFGPRYRASAPLALPRVTGGHASPAVSTMTVT